MLDIDETPMVHSAEVMVDCPASVIDSRRKNVAADDEALLHTTALSK